MSDISAHTYIHTEAQLVWNRFNAMMVAHSIILGALGTKIGDATNQIYVLIGSCIGILLTYLWWALTSLGWSLQQAWIKSTNSSTSDPNTALQVYDSWKKQRLHHMWRHDTIWWCAHAVIWVFLFIYLAIACFSATRMFCSTSVAT